MPLVSANGKKISPAEARMNDLAMGLLLSRFQVVIFNYSPSDDTLILRTAAADGESKAMKVVRYAACTFPPDAADLHMMPQLSVLSYHFPYILKHSSEGVLYYADDATGSWYRICYLHRNDDAGNELIVGFLSNTSEIQSIHRELTVNVSRHQITKLPLMDASSALVDQAISRLTSGEKGVLFYFDLDSYPELVSQYGQAAVESYLRQLSDVLRTDFRSGDIIGQIEDDQFIIFFSGKFTIDVIENRAQQLINLFRKVRTELIPPVACSLGVSVTGSTRMSFAKLLPKAAHSLETAKRRGKNRFCMFDE